MAAAVITVSLFLGVVLRVPSLLQRQRETNRRGWQRLIGRPKPISDDAFCCALERLRPEYLLDVLAGMVRQPKTADRVSLELMPREHPERNASIALEVTPCSSSKWGLQ